MRTIRFAPRMFGLLAVCLSVALSSCDNGSTSKAGHGTDESAPTWFVGYDTSKLSPELEATSTHEIEGGGTIFMMAKCSSDEDGQAISIDFEYHAKDSKQNNDANSYYDTEGSGDFEHVAIPYRFDGGDMLQANSQTDYKNDARVVFTYVAPGTKTDPMSGLVMGISSMFGGLQDLQKFLHAQRVDFQLPLGGGLTEIVTVSPQDSGFQSFVAKCHIDIHAIDAAIAKQDADQKAAEDQKARENAEAQKQQQEQAAATALAAQQKASAVRDACSSGQTSLRVRGTTNLENPDYPGEVTTTWVAGGQIVQTVGDQTAAQQGKCSVSYMNGDRQITGRVPIDDLDPADATTAATGAQ